MAAELKEIRCLKCNRKLAEHSIIHGVISIQCTKTDCKNLNVYRFNPVSYDLPSQKSTNVI